MNLSLVGIDDQRKEKVAIKIISKKELVGKKSDDTIKQQYN